MPVDSRAKGLAPASGTCYDGPQQADAAGAANTDGDLSSVPYEEAPMPDTDFATPPASRQPRTCPTCGTLTPEVWCRNCDDARREADRQRRRDAYAASWAAMTRKRGGG